jgi:hypothetical protein
MIRAGHTRELGIAMSVDELTAQFIEQGFEVHGRALGQSGECHLIASRRISDVEKEGRLFFAAKIRDPDGDWVRYMFSVNKTALASECMRRFTNIKEEFLLQAGLLRFRRLLLEDDDPGRSKEVVLTSRSAPEEFLMYDEAWLRSEVSHVQLKILELLWQHRYRGIKGTDKRTIEEHVCSAPSVVNTVLDSFQQREIITDGAWGISITDDGEIELERLQLGSQAQGAGSGLTAREAKGEIYDIFISHASEDKDAFVRPLAEALRSAGIKVWYDEFTLKWGASLRESIDRGLATSRFGLVVLSHTFFAKEWPQRELNGLFATMKAGERRILPIWHQLSGEEVKKYSPMLSDLLAVNSAEGVPAVVQKVLSVCREP